MSDEFIFDRLASHGAIPAQPDPTFEDRLHAVLTRELTRPRRSNAQLLLAAALLAMLALGAVAVAGGLVRLPTPEARLINPALLAPCDVLPGPGGWQGEPPRTHDGDPRIGGRACAYGWDGGNNPHFQLRPRYTTAAEAEALAERLLTEPLEILVDDRSIRAWIGTVEAMEFTYVAVVAHEDPYLFVAFTRDLDGPVDRRPPRPMNDRDRLRGTELVYGVMGNLEALNANESPDYEMEVTP